MSLIYDHTPSGLVVAHEAADEASVRRALKAFDPRLMLDYAIDQQWQRKVWQVLCRLSADRPPQVVCRWRDEHTGEPLTLSHGLVERAKQLHVASRAPVPDADADNLEHRAQLAAEAEEVFTEQAKDLVDRLRGRTSHLLPRGTHRRRTQFSNVTDIR